MFLIYGWDILAGAVGGMEVPYNDKRNPTTRECRLLMGGHQQGHQGGGNVRGGWAQ